MVASPASRGQDRRGAALPRGRRREHRRQGRPLRRDLPPALPLRRRPGAGARRRGLRGRL